MKVVILAGGQGTRLSEVTTLVPKPMVKIGNMPILFHIIKIFCKFGHTDYYIATGYKSQIVKNFFKFKSKTYKIINKQLNDYGYYITNIDESFCDKILI